MLAALLRHSLYVDRLCLPSPFAVTVTVARRCPVRSGSSPPRLAVTRPGLPAEATKKTSVDLCARGESNLALDRLSLCEKVVQTTVAEMLTEPSDNGHDREEPLTDGRPETRSAVTSCVLHRVTEEPHFESQTPATDFSACEAAGEPHSFIDLARGHVRFHGRPLANAARDCPTLPRHSRFLAPMRAACQTGRSR